MKTWKEVHSKANRNLLVSVSYSANRINREWKCLNNRNWDNAPVLRSYPFMGNFWLAANSKLPTLQIRVKYNFKGKSNSWILIFNKSIISQNHNLYEFQLNFRINGNFRSLLMNFRLSRFLQDLDKAQVTHGKIAGKWISEWIRAIGTISSLDLVIKLVKSGF